jgi:hypothetical protein
MTHFHNENVYFLVVQEKKLSQNIEHSVNLYTVELRKKRKQ